MASSEGRTTRRAILLDRRGVPSELIEVHAYFKWLRRCQQWSRAVHGFDKQDWFEAERELSDVWNTIDPNEVIHAAARVLGKPPEVSDEAVRVRAYFKSENRRRSSDPQRNGSPEQDWNEARAEEAIKAFAAAFLRHLPAFSRGELRVFWPED